jgi:hypothetical protein
MGHKERTKKRILTEPRGILFHYSDSLREMEKKYTDHKMCASFFSITFSRRTFVYDKYVTCAPDMRRDPCISCKVSAIFAPFQIKLEYVETILLKILETKFHENTFSDS